MVEINQEKCIGCGKCAEDCVARNIKIKEKKAEVKADCIKCGHCVAVCPVNAVSIPEYDMDEVAEYHEECFRLNPRNVLNAIKFRRSIRSYQPKQVTQEDLELLVQAGRYTATAVNNQGNFFVIVQKECEELKGRVWRFIDEMEECDKGHISADKRPFIRFNQRRKADSSDDFLFRNAPAVLFITSKWPLDAGLAAQNIETMAVSLGIGVLYNGYLARIVEADGELKKWLGIEGKTIQVCMLLGYPARNYRRTAPRKKANVIWR